MYTVYSSKNKKLGILQSDGSLETANKKLKDIYDTLLNMGVFAYSVKRSKKIIEVVRKPMRSSDGESFLFAIIDNLDYLGFIIKED